MGDENLSSPSAYQQFGNENPKSSSENIHLKILVPSISAGAIIGRGGEAIAQIQRESSTKVKMAKQNDFYPGTAERVCLIVGSIEGVMMVHDYIMAHIREKRESTSGGNGVGAPSGLPPGTVGDVRQHGDRSQQMKLLVPNTTAGMIIGKGGAYIREIKEQSGAFVQLSQKAMDSNLLERCITIAGDAEQCRKASLMIVQKIAEDPQSNSCPYTSYADVMGPVPSAYPTGSPYAQRTTQVATLVSVPSLPLGTAPLLATTPTASNVLAAGQGGGSYLALQTAPSLLLGPNFGGGGNSALSLISPTESLNLSSSTTGSLSTPGSLGNFQSPFQLSTGLGPGNTGGAGAMAPQNPLLAGRMTLPFAGHLQSAQVAGGLNTTLISDLYGSNPLFSGTSTGNPSAGPISPLNGVYAFPTHQNLYAQSTQSLATSPLGGLSPTGPTLLGGAFLSPMIGTQPQALGPTLSYQSHQQQSSAVQQPLGDGLGYTRSVAANAQAQAKFYGGPLVKDLQVPDACLNAIVENQSEMQRSFGVGIRIHHPESGTGPVDMSTGTPSGSSGPGGASRLVSVSGTPAGVQGALIRIQQICEQWQAATGSNVRILVDTHVAPVTMGKP